MKALKLCIAISMVLAPNSLMLADIFSLGSATEKITAAQGRCEAKGKSRIDCTKLIQDTMESCVADSLIEGNPKSPEHCAEELPWRIP